mgnify:CR=1 FL=1
MVLCRAILCGVGSSRIGWLGGRETFLCYHTGQAINDDYHKHMNSIVFNNWLVEKVIPLLPHASVLVIDRASYHMVKTADTRLPDKKSKKGLLSWLRGKIFHLWTVLGETGRRKRTTIL